MIRKHFAGFAASALALAVSAQALAGTVTTDGADIVIKTKSGLEVGTTDKESSFKINGRIQAELENLVVQQAGTLTATLTGTVDCGATPPTLEGKLHGDIVVVNVFRGPVAGTSL